LGALGALGATSAMSAMSAMSAERWTAARPGSRLSHRHPLRAAQRHSVADVATGTGLRIGMTCWRRLRDWQHESIWDLLHFALLHWLARDGDIDWSRAIGDSCSVRAMWRNANRSESDRPRQEREQTASDL